VRYQARQYFFQAYNKKQVADTKKPPPSFSQEVGPSAQLHQYSCLIIRLLEPWV
jgi:hypothetical protein